MIQFLIYNPNKARIKPRNEHDMQENITECGKYGWKLERLEYSRQTQTINSKDECQSHKVYKWQVKQKSYYFLL